MTIPEARSLTEPIRARFAMMGRFWDEAVQRQYVLAFIGADFAAGRAAVERALSDSNEPPTDRDIERILSLTAAPPVTAAGRTEGRWCDPRQGKRLFEEAFRKSYAEMPVYELDERGCAKRDRLNRPILATYGKPVPEYWERRFASWHAAQDTDGGAMGAMPWESDPFAGDPEPAAAQSPSPAMPAAKRREMEDELRAVSTPADDFFAGSSPPGEG